MGSTIVLRLAELGGVGRRRDLVRTSADKQALAAALADREVVRVAHGVYGLPGHSREAAAATVHGAVVGCVSAVALAGVAVLTAPDRPHLVVPRTRGRTPSALRDEFPVVLHAESWLSSARASRLGVAPITLALARMMICRPPTEAVVAIDGALRRRLTTVDAIAAALPRTGSTRPRIALNLADGRSRSPLETVARLALRAADLRVEPGVVIPMVGEVDLLVEGRIVVELDGFAYHRGRREFDEDRRRDRELALQGYVVLRFTARDVLYDIDRVVAAVRAALAAPRRPTRGRT